MTERGYLPGVKVLRSFTLSVRQAPTTGQRGHETMESILSSSIVSLTDQAQVCTSAIRSLYKFLSS